MGIRNIKREELRRIECKNLDARLTDIMRHGLNGSPFEAQAVLNAVHEVYHPFMDDACTTAPPGKVTLVAVSADEPAGKAVGDCEKLTVCLSLHRGAEDDKLRVKAGPAAWRRARLLDLCQQALSQGALLTREDLAHHVFFVGTRTISRDLALMLHVSDAKIADALCQDEDQTGQVVPRRATVHDVGTGQTHKRIICRKRYLEGKAPPEVARETYHRLEAVDRYLGQYDRVRHCRQQGLDESQTAYTLDCSIGLVRPYLEIDRELEDAGAVK